MDENERDKFVPRLFRPQTRKTSHVKRILLMFSSCRRLECRTPLGLRLVARSVWKGRPFPSRRTSSTSFPHRHHQIDSAANQSSHAAFRIRPRRTRSTSQSITPASERLQRRFRGGWCNRLDACDTSSSTSSGSQRRVGVSCCFRPSELFEAGR